VARVATILDTTAWVGSCLPMLLALYFWLMLVRTPEYVIALLLSAALAFHVCRRPDRILSPPQEPSTPTVGRVYTVLLVVLLILFFSPLVRSALLLGRGSTVQGIYFYDEAYSLMIAQGLARGLPPPDLSYSGFPLEYHPGGPLLTHLLSRYLHIPIHTAFYVAVPLLAKVFAMAAVYRILLMIFPGWTLGSYVICVAMSAGVFLLNPYNIVWNIRNSLIGGHIEPATVFGGMSIAHRVWDIFEPRTYYAWELGVLFVLILISNVDRAGGLLLTTTLFAIFLSKFPLLIPVGLVWIPFSVWKLVRCGEMRFVLSGVVALAMCAAAFGVLLPGESLYHIRLTLGPGIGELADSGSNFARVLNFRGLIPTALLGMTLLVLGTHLYGLSVVYKGYKGLSSFRTQSAIGASVALLLAGVAIMAGLFVSFVALVPDRVLQERFQAVHEGVKGLLWRPFSSYLQDHLDITLLYATQLAGASFAILAAGAVWAMFRDTRSAIVRAIAGGVILVSIVLAGWRSYDQTYGAVPRNVRWVPPDATAALSTIPVKGAIIVTNEIRYGDNVERHLPMMNAWAPAVFGHQFWASNFMFGTFGHPDASRRLHELKAFWDSGDFTRQCQFLRREHITHLLVRVDLLSGPVMEDSECWRTLYKNGTYVVQEVYRDGKPAHAS
jgi:hypothetical protein